MYLIHLNGVKNPVEVSTIKGDSIKKMLEANPDNNQFIDINRRMFRASAIKAFEYVSDNRSEREPEPASVPLTKEEQEKRNEILSRMRKELEDKGIFKDKQRKYYPDTVWNTHCVVCGRELPKGLARVCSSICYQKAPLEKSVNNS